MQFLPLFGHKKINIKKLLCTKKFTFSTMLIVAFLSQNLIPLKTAHAGFFSLISGLTSDEVSAKAPDTAMKSNSQNMPLLEAAINTDPNPHKTTESNVLVYDNALYAEIGPQGTVADIENKVSGEISLYTVREGDTISKVAQMFDVSVNTIIWANELGSNTTLREGQLLVILPISGVKYTIKKGDTIKGIVSRYKADLQEVLSYNDLTTSTVLVAGNTIIIPDAEPTLISVPKIAQTRTIVVTNKAHDTNGPYYPGYYIRPITGGIKSQDLHGYNAIDLAAPLGTAIHASAAGKVISSISNGGWNGGYGNYVIISHNNGTQTLYAHTQKNYVKVGDTVEQDEMIAKIGMTGKTTGAHVHFEIRGAKMPPSF